MTTVRTNIYLEERQAAALDQRAGAEGISRAELIRRLLDEALGGAASLADDLDAIDAAFGVAAIDDPPPTRTHDDRAAHLARLWGS